MLKFSCLAILVIVGVSWSQVDAKPRPKSLHQGLQLFKHRSVVKRSTEDESLDLSPETEEQFAKGVLAGLLLLTVDSSAEERTLTNKYKEAVDKKWDSMDDFATHILKVYEDVTGRKPDQSSESNE